MRKNVKTFDLSMLQEIVTHTEVSTDEVVYNPHFALVNHSNTRMFRYVAGKGEPLSINDYRLGLIVSGEAHASINLIERHIKKGSIVFFAPGSIVHPHRFSDDLCIRGFALFDELPFSNHLLPEICRGMVRDFQMSVDATTFGLLGNMLDVLWKLAHADPFAPTVFNSMVATYFNLFNHLYLKRQEQTPAPSHQTDIFNRFIQLVNSEYRRQHNLSYYAGRLFLTQRYLGNIVKRVSGTTAKAWIDRALLTEAKIMLRHTDMPVGDIADALHFSNPAFFCKYFRRLNGCSPLDYRNG